MKITNPLKWAFDPRTKDLHPIFKSEKGRIIFGSIKSQHITDQYFHDNCYSFLKIINKKFPKNPKKLVSLANYCGLGCYGRMNSNTKNYEGNFILTKPDMEFWGELFDALNGKLKIIMEYPTNIINKGENN